ncbi:MAG: hypothetical protein RL758_578, partial [Pseudomonadota bacterium]
VSAILSGEIDLLVADIAPSMPLIESGRVRPIAITSAKRSKKLPNIPTMAESGLPGYEVDVFVGLFTKAGTPPVIIDKLQREIAAVLQSPEVQQQIENLGMSPSGISPQQTAAMLKSEIAKYTSAARRANIKSE